jgi:hypothetical protein
MKKIFVTTILFTTLFASVHSFAQVTFGVKGSFNMYNMTVKDIDNKKVETKMIPAFDGGVFAELPIVDEFYFRPELLYAAKGAKSKDASPEVTSHLSYLVLPLEFLYKGDLSGGKIFLGIGPYLAMGIGGKVSYGSTDYDIKFKNDVSITDADSTVVHYKPIDFGGIIIAGYEFGNGFSFAINASLGLSNIESKFDGKQLDSSTKNNGFGLTLGYRFIR